MPNAPKISVLLPVYNAGKYLLATLRSISQQTFSGFEVVAINNGCNDGSEYILQQWSELDSRFRIIPQAHSSLVETLNHGLSQCRSNLVARMDADDIMLRHRLSLQYRYLEQHPDTAVLAGCIKMISESPLGKGTQYYADWSNQCLGSDQIAQNIYWESPLVHPTVMYRKDVILQYGGYRDGPFPEDYELWLRLHANYVVFHKLSQVVLYWRDHSQRMTRTDDDFSADAFARVRYQYLLQDPRIQANQRPIAIWGGGRRTRKRLKLLLDQGFLPDFWVDVKAGRIGQMILRRPVISPEQLTAEQPRPFVFLSVKNHGAIDEIRQYLDRAGFQVGVDYLPVG